MIFDGYWRHELLHSIIKLKLYFYVSKIYSWEYLFHKVNKEILLSAAAIRKITDDELDYKKQNHIPITAIPILNYKVRLAKYPFIGDETFIFNKPIIEDYDQSQKEIVNLGIRDVCNQIIHSYIWGTVTKNSKEVYGFLMVSDFDKAKCIYLLELKEWLSVLDTCISESTV